MRGTYPRALATSDFPQNSHQRLSEAGARILGPGATEPTFGGATTMATMATTGSCRERWRPEGRCPFLSLLLLETTLGPVRSRRAALNHRQSPDRFGEMRQAFGQFLRNGTLGVPSDLSELVDRGGRSDGGVVGCCSHKRRQYRSAPSLLITQGWAVERSMPRRHEARRVVRSVSRL